RPVEAYNYVQQAIAYTREHEEQTLADYAGTILAWLQLKSGAWDEAERAARRAVEGGTGVPQLLGRTVLTDLAVRRGDPDANERLAELAAAADRAGELQRIAPVLELRVVHALTNPGTSMPTREVQQLLDTVRQAQGELGSWGAALVASIAAVAGIDVDLDAPS